MAQAASILPTEQSLYIAQDEPVFNKISGEAIATTKSSTFFLQPAVFNYGDRARINIEVLPAFAPYFSLIRGLIEFNRGKEFTFLFHRDTNSFEIDIEATHQERLSALLALVNTELFREIRFKQKLKEVIRFEARYKAKTARMYATFL